MLQKNQEMPVRYGRHLFFYGKTREGCVQAGNNIISRIVGVIYI